MNNSYVNEGFARHGSITVSSLKHHLFGICTTKIDLKSNCEQTNMAEVEGIPS